VTLKITRETLLNGTVRARVLENAARNPHLRYRTDAEMAALLEEILAQHDATQDLWVFGYGSLIWNPAFHYVEKRPALLEGWHRRFCLKVFVNRGSPETPGVMLGLDQGGECHGVAFRVAAAKVREELGILWQREMYGGAYHARFVPLETEDGPISAMTFVINHDHPRYMRELSLEQTVAMISTGCGDLGTCREYLENTVNHLRELGLNDEGLARIAAALPNP
jgi:glutathione-specific gamma-glutamylcyclotransferase